MLLATALFYMSNASATAYQQFYDCFLYGEPDQTCWLQGGNGKRFLGIYKSGITMLSDAENFKLRGTLLVPIRDAGVNESPFENLLLREGNVNVEFRDHKVHNVSGQVKLLSDELNRKLPLQAIMDMGKPMTDFINSNTSKWASIGYAQGSKLKELGAHTSNGLGYLYVSTDITQEASMKQGDLKMSAGTSGGMTLVFKRPPNGAYVYAGITPSSYGVSLELGEVDNTGQDWGVGYAFSGAPIPFIPKTPLKTTEIDTSFYGNLALDGLIEIKQLFLEIDGSVIAHAPVADLQNIARAIAKGETDPLLSGIKLGANGKISLAQSLFGVLDARVKLADASLGVLIDKDAKNPMKAFVSGKFSAGDWKIMKGLPITPSTQELNASALLLLTESGSIGTKSYLKIEGSYSVNKVFLPKGIRDVFSDMTNIKGTATIKRGQVIFKGTLGKRTNFKGIRFAKDTKISINIPTDSPEKFKMIIEGDTNLAGLNQYISRKGKLVVTKSGVKFFGEINLPKTTARLRGYINNVGLHISATSDIYIPLNLFEKNDDVRHINGEFTVYLSGFLDNIAVGSTGEVEICTRFGCREFGVSIELDKTPEFCINFKRGGICIGI